MKNKSLILAVVIAAILVPIIYFIIFQPNIQLTDIRIAQSLVNAYVVSALDQGRVSGHGNFDYTATQSGKYTLVFSNDFSIFSTKSVSGIYSLNGNSNNISFLVPAGTHRNIEVDALAGQIISGTFVVSGGSGLDVDFHIDYNSCTQSVPISFGLINSGQVDGTAVVAIKADGKTAWSNQYFVKKGHETTDSTTVTLNDCNQHQFNVVITEQKRIF